MWTWRIFLIQSPCANGANIDYSDSEGKTTLHTAVSENQTEIALVLISKGININALNGYELNISVASNNTAMVELLFSHEAKVNIRDKVRGFTLLHYAWPIILKLWIF